MMPLEVGLAFFMTSLVLAIAPGPDNIFVLTQSALYGARAGLCTVFGLMTGILVHTFGVALGVSVIFQNSPTAFFILKLVGAAYLLYLAWLTLKSGSSEASLKGQEFIGNFALYRRGIFMNITNPKVALFFLALLPQFVDPARGALSIQMSMLGGIFILATFIVFGLVAILGGQLAHWFNRSPKYQILINRLAALVFIALALALIFT